MRKRENAACKTWGHPQIKKAADITAHRFFRVLIQKSRPDVQQYC